MVGKNLPKPMLLGSIAIIALAVAPLIAAVFPIAASGEASSRQFGLAPASGWRPGWRRCLSLEVSEAFKEKAVAIAEGDEDVQKLIGEGYSVTRVEPLLRARVEADGSVVVRATGAVVVLRKDKYSVASVWVDLEAGKVTRIVASTRTVTEKS
jgi:hypothetical protein